MEGEEEGNGRKDVATVEREEMEEGKEGREKEEEKDGEEEEECMRTVETKTEEELIAEEESKGSECSTPQTE